MPRQNAAKKSTFFERLTGVASLVEREIFSLARAMVDRGSAMPAKNHGIAARCRRRRPHHLSALRGSGHRLEGPDRRLKAQ